MMDKHFYLMMIALPQLKTIEDYGCFWKFCVNLENMWKALITYTKILPKSTYPIDIVDYPYLVDLPKTPSRLDHSKPNFLTLYLDSVSQISRLDFIT